MSVSNALYLSFIVSFTLLFSFTYTKINFVDGGGFGTNQAATINLTNLNCSNNYAMISGGCASIANTISLTLSNSLVSRNSATFGGGIYILNSTAVVLNTTITRMIFCEIFIEERGGERGERGQVDRWIGGEGEREGGRQKERTCILWAVGFTYQTPWQ
jgi:hypothetical protein